ncbi:MAG TPA: pentapeptide repeat-containing protein [Candidatus Binataceae bacterium]|nr:pentapeptide repeat-containing protein [Candidatus Binataceae bacterium]
MAKIIRFEPFAWRSQTTLHAVFTAGEKSHLHDQVFRGCELDRVDFSEANLCEAVFFRVSLSGCDFSRADLRGASFVGCDLRGANFTQAVFGQTRFDNSWLIDVRGLSHWMIGYLRSHGGLLWPS